MSLWICPVHGLYGGQVFCPHCGSTGSYVTLSASGMSAFGQDPKGLEAKPASPVGAEGDETPNPNSDRTTP